MCTGKSIGIPTNNELNGSLFFNVAGVGLDARIAGRLAVAGARRGLAGYVQATTAELLRYRAQAYSICIGGGGASEILHETALFIAIANSRQYGVGAQIAPHARLDDGRLELVVVRRQSVVRLIGRLPALFRGTLREGDGLVMRGTTDEQRASDQPVSFHVDGEPGDDAKTLQIRIHPHALSVRVNG